MTRTERIEKILSDYYGEAKADAVARIMAVFAHDDIIARYKGGETVSSIARSLGMSRAGVKYRIRRFCSPDDLVVNKDWRQVILETDGEANTVPIPRIVEEIDIRGHINVFLDGMAPPLPLPDLQRIESSIYRSSIWWCEGRTWEDGRYYYIYSMDIDKVRNYINKLKDE